MRISTWILAGVGTFGLLGCGSPLKERFYTLETPAVGAAASPVIAASLSVIVGPVTVPDMVDRPQLVLRVAPNRVVIAEEARWAEPLKTEIPRVVAAQLAQRLQGARIATSSQRATANADYRVIIDIQRFDTAPGDAVAIEALWSLRAGEAVRQTGRTLARETAGTGYDELVAAHGRALATLSGDIADAIRAAGPAR